MYSIKIEQNAEKFLKKLNKRDAEVVLNKLYSIRDNPFRYVKRLQGEKLWRLRIGDIRAVMDIIISINQIIVVRIGYRKNVYGN